MLKKLVVVTVLLAQTVIANVAYAEKKFVLSSSDIKSGQALAIDQVANSFGLYLELVNSLDSYQFFLLADI